MSLKISVQPLIEPVSLDEAKIQCRVDVDTEDTLIASYIKSAREECEKIQNRAYINRTYLMYIDSFPCSDVIKIPINPLFSVTSIKYYDTSDAEATITSTDYLVETDDYESQISLKYSKSWPSTTLRPHRGVLITFVSGYGTDPSSTPENPKLAIKLLTADYYENREAGKASKQTIEAVYRLLGYERVH